MKPLDPQSVMVPFSPHRLISLADMIKFVLWEYISAGIMVDSQCRAYSGDDALDRAVLADEDKTKLSEDLNHLEATAKKLHLSHALELIGHLKFDLPVIPRFEVGTHVGLIWRMIMSEAKENHFAFVEPKKVEFFEQDQLFGKKVFNRFKRAQYDIKEAGNCLATGANTACVFHLMRVAEHGLRALARRFDIELVNTTTRRPKPIEEATWQEIIDEVNLEIRNARNRATPAQEKRLEAYLHLNTACKAIKHLWRNPVSHLRGSYTEEKAKIIYSSVRDLMQNACVVLSGRR